MNLNADLGEGAGADEEILPQIDSANIACGVYAGSVSITRDRRASRLRRPR